MIWFMSIIIILILIVLIFRILSTYEAKVKEVYQFFYLALMLLLNFQKSALRCKQII